MKNREEKYMQVWEIMKDENNDPNQKVIINRPASDSPTEPMVKTIYEGKLKNIPPEIAMKTVMETGWSVGSRCASIRVRPQETRRQRKPDGYEL